MASNQNTGSSGKSTKDDDTGSGKQGNSQSGTTGNRGFASMDPDQQREIAAEGGRAAHASGNAHEFTSEEARKAGAMSHKNDGSQQSDSGQSGSRSESGGNQSGRKESDSDSGGSGGKSSGSKSGSETGSRSK